MYHNNTPNLAQAVVEVMKECAVGIDKNMVVGQGQNAYKAMADKDVKTLVGKSMANHGLSILQIGVLPEMDISRSEETNQYGTKQKTSVFTAVTTKYLLLHISGESQVLTGYGHGVDPQDKSAGKATTYALKNLLIYTFLIPTARIDDADAEHSEDIAVPKGKPVATQQKTQKPAVPLTNEQLNKAIDSGIAGIEGTLRAIKRGVALTATAEQILILENKLIELNIDVVVPEIIDAPETNKTDTEIPWLTPEKVNITLESGIKGIKATIAAITKKKLKARDIDIELLNEKLKELTT